MFMHMYMYTYTHAWMIFLLQMGFSHSNRLNYQKVTGSNWYIHHAKGPMFDYQRLVPPAARQAL